MNARHAVIAVILGLQSLCASAQYVLETLPGTTPQATRPLSYFPVPLAVRARAPFLGDDQLLAGIEVTFRGPCTFAENEPWVYMPRGMTGQCEVTVVTGADGIARPPEEFQTGEHPGNVRIVASAPAIGRTATFNLTVLPSPPTHSVAVAGNEQAVAVNSSLQPWVIRILDADGRPVPYAAAVFYSPVPDTAPGGSWNGGDQVFAKADATGLAASPPLRANGVEGWGSGYAGAEGGLFILFDYYLSDGPYGVTARLLSGPPSTTEANRPAIAPWVIGVIDAAGAPVGGVPVTFDGACGFFVGSGTSVVVPTDAQGLATSPAYLPTTAGGCQAFASVRGLRPGAEIPIGFDYVFDPNLVQITPSQRFVTTREGRRFTLEFAFSESGVPIYGAPFDVHVVASRHGPSAALVSQEAPFGTNLATLEFLANDRHGSYAIVVQRGPAWTWVVVEQRKR